MTETICGDLIAFYCCLVDCKLQWCSYNLTAFCVPCITVNWHYIYFLIISAFPSCHSKKRKVDFEYHAYKAQWRLNYLVNKPDGKALYLLCNDTIAVLKNAIYIDILRPLQYSQLTGKKWEKLENSMWNISSW